MELTALLKSKIRDVPDFPKPGILFKDITPVLQDRKLFAEVIDAFGERYLDKKIDTIVGVESRGFLFGAALAYRLGCSLVPVRKSGKLPYKTIQASYDLEYGSATVEMHIDAIRKGERIIVIDDLLATGGTADATCRLVEQHSGKIVECAFVVELTFLNGRDKLKGREVFSLVQY